MTSGPASSQIPIQLLSLYASTCSAMTRWNRQFSLQAAVTGASGPFWSQSPRPIEVSQFGESWSPPKESHPFAHGYRFLLCESLDRKEARRFETLRRTSRGSCRYAEAQGQRNLLLHHAVGPGWHGPDRLTNASDRLST